MTIPDDYPTLRPRERRVVMVASSALAIAAFALISAGAVYVALRYFAWHPVPDTSVGCSLHKRFHSSRTTRITSRELGLQSDCLKVELLGAGKIVRDPRSLTRVRDWFDARSLLWFEGPLVGLRVVDRSTEPPFIELRPCSARPAPAADPHVTVVDDWIESSLGKGFRRPICRGEWRQLAALLNES